MLKSRICEVNEEHILFDDGTEITFDHEQDCCEYNYADFEQIDDIARNFAFDTDHLMFESVEDAGFRFGNQGAMFFVPCYSEQNGYYSSDITIFKNGEKMLYFNCEFVDS